jgi:hypothetical protein
MSVCKQLLIAEGLHGRRQRAMFFLGNLAWYVETGLLFSIQGSLVNNQA